MIQRMREGRRETKAEDEQRKKRKEETEKQNSLKSACANLNLGDNYKL